MAENQIDGRVIGISLDGVGYGSDGQIWGGEVLLADYRGFERAAHLAYVPMPGGAAAIREPWRMAVGYLAAHYGAGLLHMNLPFVRRLDPRKVGILLRMIERRVNCPLTSSCGRLFDAVAALIGLRERVNYEAQAAIELEMVAADSTDSGAYPFELRREGGCWQIGTRPLFDAIIEDLARGVPNGAISRHFHNGLVAEFAHMAALMREETALERVCLSGGVFQNVLVLEQLSRSLQQAGFEVFTHAEVPTGDGGLSLGQAVIAAHAVQ